MMKKIDDAELLTITGGKENITSKGPGNETTIPFQCSCGKILEVRLGDKEVQCDNPKCLKVHKISG